MLILPLLLGSAVFLLIGGAYFKYRSKRATISNLFVFLCGALVGAMMAPLFYGLLYGYAGSPAANPLFPVLGLLSLLLGGSFGGILAVHAAGFLKTLTSQQ